MYELSSSGSNVAIVAERHAVVGPLRPTVKDRRGDRKPGSAERARRKPQAAGDVLHRVLYTPTGCHAVFSSVNAAMRSRACSVACS